MYIHILKTSLFNYTALRFWNTASFAVARKQYYRVKHQSYTKASGISVRDLQTLYKWSAVSNCFPTRKTSLVVTRNYLSVVKRRDNVMTDVRVQNWWWHPLSNTGKPTNRFFEWTDGAWCHEIGQLRSHVSCDRIYLLSRYIPKNESTDHRHRHSVL